MRLRNTILRPPTWILQVYVFNAKHGKKTVVRRIYKNHVSIKIDNGKNDALHLQNHVNLSLLNGI